MPTFFFRGGIKVDANRSIYRSFWKEFLVIFLPKHADSMEFELVSYKIHSPGMDHNNLPMGKFQVLNHHIYGFL